jgi:hypothetical protein
VADPTQYLRLTIGGQPYLLPSVLRYTVESRDSLMPNTDERLRAAAWRVVGDRRWPAYGLDAQLNVLPRPDRWERAVFLEGPEGTVGFIVDEMQLLARGEVTTTSFTPLGAASTLAGHLFSGARLEGNRAVLVIEPQALVAYLTGLGD